MPNELAEAKPMSKNSYGEYLMGLINESALK